MVKGAHLDVPIIGVARRAWNLEQFRARAHDSLEKQGGVDAVAFKKLSSLLHYVSGDRKNSEFRNAGLSTIRPVLFATCWHNATGTDEEDFRLAA